MTEKWCELCAAKSLKKRLRYCQVNFDEGVVLCENTMCAYPFGSTDVGSLLVKKTSQKAEKKRRDPSLGKTVETQESRSPNGLPSQIYWSNADSLCWLDSVLAVLVNNRCLQLCLGKLQLGKESILQKLCDKFNKAQSCGAVAEGDALLNEARVDVFEFLKSKMRCELGVNDSSLMALNLLLKENVYIAEKFMLEYCWRFTCATCGYVQVNRLKKLIVSFPNTAEDFAMPSGYFVRPCYKCKSAKQKCTLEFQQMPPCVMVHFVEGVSNKEFLTSQFTCHGKEYQLCQLIQYKRDPDHFVSWVKSSNGTHWAEVDDMKDQACIWKKGLPSVPLNQIHIALWERTSLYLKDLPTTDTTTNIATGHKKLTVSQRLHGGNTPAHSNSLRTRIAKDPPLVRRISTTVGCKEPLNPSLSKALNEPAQENRTVCKNVTGNTKNLKENTGNKRKTVGTFEPYIPRKKRNPCGESDGSDFSPDNKAESVYSLSSSRDQSKTFLPWQDAVSVDALSVDAEEKQKSCIADNQSDSGYSSPASNSSCLSLTMPSAKDESGFTDFLESLDSLDLPKGVDLSRHGGDSGSVDLTTSKSIAGDVDDILGEIFPKGQFQNAIEWLDRDINCDDFLADIPQ